MSEPVARSLLERARDDVAAVEATVEIDAVTDAIVGFHAQQAVEKALKAVLASRGITFPFSHDLEGLIERCVEHEIAVPSELADNAGSLTPYAARHRYGAEPPSLVTRAEALRLAVAAVKWATDAVAD